MQDNVSYQIKSIQGRWMTIDESIYDILDIYSMSLYTAIRYEGDYSLESSKVSKTIAQLSKKAKIKRAQSFKSLNILENLGLIKRCNENRLGEIGIIYVSKHLYYFNTPVHTVDTQPVHDMDTPVHTVDTPVHTVDTPVHTVDTLDQESFQESFQGVNTRARDDKNLTKIKPNEYVESTFDTAYKNPLIVKEQYGKTDIVIHDSQPFEIFWNLYPRKTGKSKAKAQWIHDGCDKIADEIIDKLRLQVARDKTFLDGYAPNPHKYLVENRYQDEIFEGKKNKTVYDHKDKSWAKKPNPEDDIFNYFQ